MSAIGSHVDSHYARTQSGIYAAKPLDGTVDVETCVIGGGMAGLATALDVAERGRSVALLERHAVGWGASGRNGGFVSAGYPTRPAELIEQVGRDDARTLYALSREGLALVRDRIDRYAIDCDRVFGALRCRIGAAGPNLRDFQTLMADTFDHPMEYWPQARLRAALATARYTEALFDGERFAVHPLNLARGTARALIELRGRVFEETPATRVQRVGTRQHVRTPRGTVRADHVVIAGGGHVGWLDWRLGAATIPVATYVMATEPLGANLRGAIGVPYAIFDNNVATNYYRMLGDGRLLWGGRVGLTQSTPARIGAALTRDVARFYPDLGGVRVETAWSGLMPYTRARMPAVGKLRDGVWYAAGFGGLGMALTTTAGRLLGAAIAEGDDRWRLWARFGLPFAAGRMGRVPAQIIYHWSRMKDGLS